MDKLLYLGGEFAGVAASILVAYFFLLLFRSPHHARWLEGDAATTAIMVSLMTLVIFTAAWLAKGLNAVIDEPMSALGFAAAYFALVAWLGWKLLRMGARLKAADEGRSPFRLGQPHRPARGRRRKAA